MGQHTANIGEHRGNIGPHRPKRGQHSANIAPFGRRPAVRRQPLNPAVPCYAEGQAICGFSHREEGGSAHVADPRNRCRLAKNEVLGICSNFGGTHRMKFAEKRSKNSNFLQQSLFRNAVNISVLAFVSLLQRKMQKLEFVGIYKVLCK